MQRNREAIGRDGTRQPSPSGHVVPDSSCRARKHAPLSASVAATLAGEPSPTLIVACTNVKLRLFEIFFNSEKYAGGSTAAAGRVVGMIRPAADPFLD